MKYAAIFTYPPDRSQIQEARPRHREYLTGLKQQGRLVTAGPFTDDSGALIIYEAESPAEVDELIRNDPFHAAGVFVNYELKPWNQVF